MSKSTKKNFLRSEQAELKESRQLSELNIVTDDAQKKRDALIEKRKEELYRIIPNYYDVFKTDIKDVKTNKAYEKYLEKAEPYNVYYKGLIIRSNELCHTLKTLERGEPVYQKVYLSNAELKKMGKFSQIFMDRKDVNLKIKNSNIINNRCLSCYIPLFSDVFNINIPVDLIKLYLQYLGMCPTCEAIANNKKYTDTIYCHSGYLCKELCETGHIHHVTEPVNMILDSYNTMFKKEYQPDLLILTKTKGDRYKKSSAVCCRDFETYIRHILGYLHNTGVIVLLDIKTPVRKLANITSTDLEVNYSAKLKFKDNEFIVRYKNLLELYRIIREAGIITDMYYFSRFCGTLCHDNVPLDLKVTKNLYKIANTCSSDFDTLEQIFEQTYVNTYNTAMNGIRDFLFGEKDGMYELCGGYDFDE